MNRAHSGVAPLLLIAGLAALTPTAGAECAARGDGGSGSLPETETEPEAGVSESPDERRRVQLFPAGDLYIDGLAGPHRRGFGVVYNRLRSTDIPDTGDSLFGLVLGGRFGVLRVHPAGRTDRAWQVGIVAGFYGQFDIDRSYDNIGWDGFYGAALTAKLAEDWTAKVAVFHTSSHVGDEYAERTGRRRIGYTREELVLAVSKAVGERWRALAEAGWAYGLRNEELQKAGRLRGGVEYLAPETLWGGRVGWYAAADLSAVAERGWQLSWGLDAGLLLSPLPRRWRLGLAYYSGRTPLGEFFQTDQSLLSLGLWLDL